MKIQITHKEKKIAKYQNIHFKMKQHKFIQKNKLKFLSYILRINFKKFKPQIYNKFMEKNL